MFGVANFFRSFCQLFELFFACSDSSVFTDSSDESENIVDLDDKTQLNIEKNTELEQEIEISINP